MLPPSFFLRFLLLLLLVAISSPSIAASLSTVAISRISNVVVVCAVVRPNANRGYDLSCTSLPTGHRRIYRSGPISSFAIAGGDGFLCLLSLSTDVSTMVWWDLYQESYNGWPPDYRRVYSGPPLADLSAGDTHVCGVRGGSLPRPTCWRWNQFTFPEGVYFSDIAVGGDFVCGLLLSREIACFGNDIGVVGQEPPGTYSTVAAGTRHACAVTGDGKLVCWGAGKPEVGVIPIRISSLALGENKTCALGSHGGVMCWGDNSSLPSSLANTEFVAIHAKGSTICGILRINYSLACWGSAVFCHKPVVFEGVLPGTCMPTSSCRCGPLEGSGQLCANGRVVCSLCELGREASSPRAPLPPPPPPASPNAAATPRRRKTVFVVIGSVGFAIGLVTLILCLLYFARCNGRIHDSGAARRPLAPGLPSALARPHGSGGLHAPIECRFSSLFCRGHSAMVEEFPLSVLLAATDNFAESQKVGSGSFGSVYRATLDDGRVVAIKRAETSASSSTTAPGPAENKRPDKESAFLSELALLSRVNHKNLVRLLGYCNQGPERVLVYEFMANGSLHDHLHRLPGATLGSWGARLRVALDAARGLEYLHTYAVPPIIHRDIKSSNILLDETWTAKVSDFGLSLMSPVEDERRPDYHPPDRAAGTVGYMDPEYYRLQHLTAKSDVYSFGVVLLELLTGCRVIHQNEDSGTPRNVVEFAMPHIAADDVHRVLDPRVPTPKPSEIEAVTYVGYLAIDCVSPEGRERPTMTEVVDGLERSLDACEPPSASLSRSTTVRSI
ncbi:unnamed protein product [Musa acuminata subsp. malaccensis]|uniref:(wild Malaysian banana) hypothetical protein n=1 Tax=Musa acuminata subsp. malaccensis TaxID=214687 RepID=A0A804KCA1_MUSAM|nr:PREDICTED: serine/threonine-protein kinase-like protein CCR4 [Musa acuminata subsp. malaccensis]CAG1833140.1 unnamed protein product [Musa acuminata subsp. malaccensis]